MIKGEASVGTGGGQSQLSVEGDAEEVSPAPSVHLEPDDVFEILRNQRRRDVLRFFFEEDRDTVELGTLAEHLAAAEFETTTAQLTSQERKRMYVSLYQCHLPKMDDAGIIDFDSDRKTLELGVNAQRLEPYLYLNEDPTTDTDESTDEDSVESSQARLYLFASAGGLLVSLASVLGAVSAAVVVQLLLPILSVAVGGFGVFQLAQNRR